jgi:hypothetical protein
MIEKRGRRFVLKSKTSGRTLGTHPTKAAAEAQETAINMSKARAAGHRMPPPPGPKRRMRAHAMATLRAGKATF